MPTNNASLYGLNRGAAQVIDTTSGAQQQFGQILARQQQQRQLELKQLTDQQAQLKPDGLRNDADRQDFFNQVNDWRNKSIAAINERDPYKKSLAQSQAQQAYMQAQQTVSKSKEQGVRDNAFNQFAMNNATRHQLTDDAIQKGLANVNVGVNDPKIINDYSTLQRAPDYEAFDKKVKELQTGAMNNAVEQDVLGKPVTVAGNSMIPWSKVKNVDAQGLAHQYMNEATFRPDFAVALEARYPDLYANAKTDDDFHVAHALAATRLANEQELSRTVNTGYNNAKDTDAQKLTLFKQEQLFRQQHPSIATVNAQQPQPFEHNFVATIQKGGVPAVQKMLSFAPSEQFEPDKKPEVTQDSNGIIKIAPPDQVELKKNGADIIKANAAAKAEYEKKPEHNGWFGTGTAKTWEESSGYLDPTVEENNPYKSRKAVEPIYIDPNNPIDIQTKAAILADKLHIPVTKINAMLGGTGGHGLNSDVKQQMRQTTSDNTMIKVNLGGRIGHIPANKYNRFIKDNPSAKKVDN